MLKENIYGYCSKFEKYKYEEKNHLKIYLKVYLILTSLSFYIHRMYFYIKLGSFYILNV